MQTQPLAVKRQKPDMANLKELSSKLKTLNEESNQANKILSDFEAKINEMNPGFDAWVVSPEHNQLDSWNYEEGNKRFSRCTHLGFGKHGDKYCLLSRHLTFVWRYDDEEGMEDWSLVKEESPRPLLQAPREYRIKALGLMEDLLEAINLEADRKLNSINAGRKVVENL